MQNTVMPGILQFSTSNGKNIKSNLLQSNQICKNDLIVIGYKLTCYLNMPIADHHAHHIVSQSIKKLQPSVFPENNSDSVAGEIKPRQTSTLQAYTQTQQFQSDNCIA